MKYLTNIVGINYFSKVTSHVSSLGAKMDVDNFSEPN